MLITIFLFPEKEDKLFFVIVITAKCNQELRTAIALKSLLFLSEKLASLLSHRKSLYWSTIFWLIFNWYLIDRISLIGWLLITFFYLSNSLYCWPIDWLICSYPYLEVCSKVYDWKTCPSTRSGFYFDASVGSCIKWQQADCGSMNFFTSEIECRKSCMSRKYFKTAHNIVRFVINLFAWQSNFYQNALRYFKV